MAAVSNPVLTVSASTSCPDWKLPVIEIVPDTKVVLSGSVTVTVGSIATATCSVAAVVPPAVVTTPE
mgnify:CR=1 FL=1